MELKNKKMLLIIIWSTAAALLVAVGIGVWVYFGQFGVYQNKQFNFTMMYPKKWQMLEGYSGTAVTFVRPKETALDVVQPNINITVQEVPVHILTLGSFSETITKQITAVFDKNINIVENKDFHFANQIGHRLIIEAPQPDNLKVMTIWVIKGSFAYIFTFLARADQYKKLVPVIDQVVNSFQIQ
jgi:hypothetical protein